MSLVVYSAKIILFGGFKGRGFPSHTKTGQSYSAIILTVDTQADHTMDHKGLWFQADHTLDIYGPVYDTPCSIRKQSLWIQPGHILGHIWFSL